MHSAEKSRDTTVDDEKLSQHNYTVALTLAKGCRVPTNKHELVLRTSVTASHVTCC